MGFILFPPKPIKQYNKFIYLIIIYDNNTIKIHILAAFT
jgi:hypothetical protein